MLCNVMQTNHIFRLCFLCSPLFFQVGFKHHKDYVSYTWAKQEESDYLRQEHNVRQETGNTYQREADLCKRRNEETAVTDPVFYIPTSTGYLFRGGVTKGGWGLHFGLL